MTLKSGVVSEVIENAEQGRLFRSIALQLLSEVPQYCLLQDGQVSEEGIQCQSMKIQLV